MSAKVIVWSLDNVSFSHESKEAAIRALLVANGGVNTAETIYFAESSDPEVALFVDANSAVNGMRLKAQEIYGESAVNRVKVEESAIAELNNLLTEWAKKSIFTFFLAIGGSTAYQIAEEDLALVETPTQRQTRKERDFLISVENDFTPDMDANQRDLMRHGALAAYRKLMPA